MAAINTNNIGVLVDFDGTITKCDTLFHYFIYTMKREPARALVACVLAPLLGILFVIPGFRIFVVSSLLWTCTVGCSPKSIVKKLKTYITYLINKQGLRENIANQLLHHQSCGHHICVVSASPAIWIRQVMNALGIADACVIGSRFMFIAGGLVMTRRCAGIEKVHRLKDKHLFQWQYAYSDSLTDLPMLSLAKHPCLVGAGQRTFLRVQRQLKRVTHVP